MVLILSMKVSCECPVLEWLDPLKLRVLKQLQTGGILTERRLAKYIGTSHTTVRAILQRLARDHLAVSRRVGRANLWSLNSESYAYLALKPILAALDKTPAPKEMLKDFLRNLFSETSVQRAFFFGSLIDGTERDESDVDLAVILKKGIAEEDEKLQRVLSQAVDRCYRLFGKRLSPYILTDKAWSQKKNSEIGRRIESGERVTP